MIIFFFILINFYVNLRVLPNDNIDYYCNSNAIDLESYIKHIISNNNFENEFNNYANGINNFMIFRKKCKQFNYFISVYSLIYFKLNLKNITRFTIDDIIDYYKNIKSNKIFSNFFYIIYDNMLTYIITHNKNISITILEDKIKQQLNKYDYNKLELINDGMEANIYNVYDSEDILIGAAKCLLTYDIKSLLNFYFEIKYNLKLQQASTYINKLKGYIIYNNRVCILMDNGDYDLKYLIKNNKLSDVDKKHIIKELIFGIKDLINNRYKHGDLLPENIIIYHKDNNYNIKFIDFSKTINILDEGYDQIRSLISLSNYILRNNFSYTIINEENMHKIISYITNSTQNNVDINHFLALIY